MRQERLGIAASLVISLASAALGCGRGAPTARLLEVPAEPRPTAHGGAVPVSGGTLRVSEDGAIAAVSVPDQDRVVLVDLERMEVIAALELAPRDEPGRIAEGPDGSFHVALRGGGAVVTIARDGHLRQRREACPAPRGIEVDPYRQVMYVACAGGELLTYGMRDASPRRVLRVAPDLRDIVVEHEQIHVSRFRSSEVLTLSPEGELLGRASPASLDLDTRLGAEVVDRPRRTFQPNVAWRMVPDLFYGELLMVHQRAAQFPVDLEIESEPPPRSAYGGPGAGSAFAALGCPPGISHATLTRFSMDGDTRGQLPGAGRSLGSPAGVHARSGTILGHALLPVDVAPSPDGHLVAVAFAASGSRPFEQLVVAERSAVLGDGCAGELRHVGMRSPLEFRQPVAVAWNGPRQLLVQYRQPNALVSYSGGRLLDVTSVRLGAAPNRGDEIFHEGTSANLACATCHPEGGDDGHVWDLGALGGARRTQMLLGDVTESAPFHWAGDLDSLDALVDEVFVERMGGRPLSGVEVGALSSFLSTMPPPPRGTPRSPGAARRGGEIFLELGCQRCHSGPRLSDGETHDVGTGEPLQTPTLLGLAARAPYLHDGRSPTLRHRFEQGHTGAHGDLSEVDEADIDDLVEYLRSL